MHKPLHPRICNIGLDANALDRDGSARDQLVEEFERLAETGELNVVLAGGVRNEVLHPRTPAGIKQVFLPKIFNLRPRLTSEQNAVRQKVLAILRGNAQPGKHEADASHLSEAAETGCGFFITHDVRMLKKRDELRPVLPPSLHIVTLDEFMTILRDKQRGSTSHSLVSPAGAAHVSDIKSEREDERTVAVELIGNHLRLLEREGREPDGWERDCLAHAINAVFRGAYGLAANEAELAMTPVGKRSPSAPLSDALDFCTRDVLQQALDAVRQEPLRLSPHFGPIILADG